MTGRERLAGRELVQVRRRRFHRGLGAIAGIAATFLAGCSEEVDEEMMVKAMSCLGALTAAEPSVARGAVPFSREEVLAALLAFASFLETHGQDFIDRHRADAQRVDARATNAAVASRTEVERMIRTGWTDQGIEGLRWCIGYLHDLPDSDRRGG